MSTQVSEKGAVYLYDDFVMPADAVINPQSWTSDVDTGGAAFVAPSAAVRGGTVTGTTDTTDNDLVQMGGPLLFEAQGGATIFEARVEVDVITTVALNVGLNDIALEGSSLPVELATLSFTSNSSTFVGFVFDVDATNDNWHIFSVDGDADTNVAIATLNTGIAPVAGEMQTFRIEVTDQGSGKLARAVFYINGKDVGTIELAVARDTLLAPYVGHENRGAAAHVTSVDYIECESARGAV
tara:strand:+ start:4714 stop:5433 length:720 start_codon:yes stop_codon:yes gene_type:complete